MCVRTACVTCVRTHVRTHDMHTMCTACVSCVRMRTNPVLYYFWAQNVGLLQVSNNNSSYFFERSAGNLVAATVVIGQANPELFKNLGLNPLHVHIYKSVRKREFARRSNIGRKNNWKHWHGWGKLYSFFKAQLSWVSKFSQNVLAQQQLNQ